MVTTCLEEFIYFLCIVMGEGFLKKLAIPIENCFHCKKQNGILNEVFVKCIMIVKSMGLVSIIYTYYIKHR